MENGRGWSVDAWGNDEASGVENIARVVDTANTIEEAGPWRLNIQHTMLIVASVKQGWCILSLRTFVL